MTPKSQWPDGSTGTKNKIVDLPCPECPNAPNRGHRVGCPLSPSPVFAAVPVVPASELDGAVSVDALLSDAVVEAVAKARWDRGWIDDQSMAGWAEAKRMGMPGVKTAREETARDLAAALKAAGKGK